MIGFLVGMVAFLAWTALAYWVGCRLGRFMR